MHGFSIGEAWSQGMAFLSAHFRAILLFVLAGVLIPLILQYAILGSSMESLLNPQAMMANGGDPTAFFAALGGGFIVVAIVGNIIQSASYFASWRHGLTNGQEDTAGAVTYALGAATMWMLASLLLVIALVIVIAVPIGFIFGFAGASGGSNPAAVGGVVLLLFVLILPLMLWLSARLSVIGPAMADARTINPFYGIAQSWRLTAPAQWSIVGYFVILIIAAVVVVSVIGIVTGIAMAGAMATGSDPTAGTIVISLVLGVLLGVPVALAYVAIPAGIYRALIPNGAGDVFA